VLVFVKCAYSAESHFPTYTTATFCTTVPQTFLNYNDYGFILAIASTNPLRAISRTRTFLRPPNDSQTPEPATFQIETP
jgi:hypothetical protein